MTALFDTFLLSSLPAFLLGITVSIAYLWLAVRPPTGDEDVDAAIHLAAGIHWCTLAYTARALYWLIDASGFNPDVLHDNSRAFDVLCNLIFAYGAYRAHRAIWLLLPDSVRPRVRKWLAWTGWFYRPHAFQCLPIRWTLARFGRGLRHLRDMTIGKGGK